MTGETVIAAITAFLGLAACFISGAVIGYQQGQLHERHVLKLDEHLRGRRL